MTGHDPGPHGSDRRPDDPLHVDSARPLVGRAIAWFPWFTPAERLVLLVLALDKYTDDDRPIHPGHGNIGRWTGLGDVGHAVRGLMTADERHVIGTRSRPAVLRYGRRATTGRRAGYRLDLPHRPPGSVPFEHEGPSPFVGLVSVLPPLDLTTLDRLALYMLALHADEHGTVALSQRRLAELCASDAKTVRCNVKRLTAPREHGHPLVRVDQESGPRATRMYSLAPLIGYRSPAAEVRQMGPPIGGGIHLTSEGPLTPSEGESEGDSERESEGESEGDSERESIRTSLALTQPLAQSPSVPAQPYVGDALPTHDRSTDDA